MIYLTLSNIAEVTLFLHLSSSTDPTRRDLNHTTVDFEIVEVCYQKIALSACEEARAASRRTPHDLRFRGGISTVNYRNCTLSRI